MLVGLAWHPTGEIWFTGSDSGLLTQLLAVRPGEPVRKVVGLPAAVVLHDVRSDGGVLLETVTRKARMLLRSVGDAEDRDISWFDYPLLRDMSADGKYILFDEQGEGGGPNYGVFIRQTDGAPAVRLGEGYANDLRARHATRADVSPGGGRSASCRSGRASRGNSAPCRTSGESLPCDGGPTARKSPSRGIWAAARRARI